MPLPLIAIPIILGLAKIGTTIATTEMNKNANEKARTESRQLAETSRRDILNQRRVDTAQAFKKLDLNQSRLDFSRDTAQQKVAMGDEQLAREKGIADRSGIESAISGLGKQDEDWMFKNKVLSRF